MNKATVIIVVCLNPALDVTHHVPAVDWAGVNRPSAVHARPGGKGLNVARTLHALGVDVLVLGLAGPAIVKPNLAEMKALAGRRLSTARGADRTAATAAAPVAGEFSHADYVSALATAAVGEVR